MKLKLFEDFLTDLKEYILFNTLSKYPEGLTYYRLQKFGSIPHSKIYRQMNRLEQCGFLEKREEQGDTGRPKYVFFLTPSGFDRLNLLKQNLIREFDNLGQLISNPEKLTEYIEDLTFNAFTNPMQKILTSNLNVEAKISELKKLKAQLKEFENIIEKNIEKLKNHRDNA